MNLLRTRTALRILLIATLPASATANQNACVTGAPVRGTLETRALDFISTSDGLILESRFSSGQTVAKGANVLRISSPDIESRLADMKGKIADLSLRKLELEKLATINRATLDDYKQRHGELDGSTLKRIERRDEIVIIEQNIQRLRRAVDDLERYRSEASGRFPYPIVLLSNPPRSAQTIRAGTALFSYLWLDRMEVTFTASASAPPPRPPAHARLGRHCVALNLSRSVLDSKNNRVHYMLQASISPALMADYARQILSAERQILLFP